MKRLTVIYGRSRKEESKEERKEESTEESMKERKEESTDFRNQYLGRVCGSSQK